MTVLRQTKLTAFQCKWADLDIHWKVLQINRTSRFNSCPVKSEGVLKKIIVNVYSYGLSKLFYTVQYGL